MNLPPHLSIVTWTNRKDDLKPCERGAVATRELGVVLNAKVVVRDCSQDPVSPLHGIARGEGQ